MHGNGTYPCPLRGDPTGAPVAASQIRTVLSRPLLAIFLPSGLKQTLQTTPSCPLSVDWQVPVDASHTLMVQSLLALAILPPQGEKDTDSTPALLKNTKY